MTISYSREKRKQRMALLRECMRHNDRLNEWERQIVAGLDKGRLTAPRLRQLTQIHARVTGPAYTGSAA